jgi:PASTA domain
MTIPASGDVGVPGVADIGAQFFAVTAPPELTLAADRTSSTIFTITNLTGRPVKVRLLARGQGGAPDAWFSVVGPSEVPMAVAATITATVQVRVPPEVPAGSHSLLLMVVAEDSMESVTGQSVAFTVPAALVTTRKRLPWWILIVAAVVLALIIGLVVFFLTRGDGTATPPEPQPPSSTIAVPDFVGLMEGEAYSVALAMGLKPSGQPGAESCEVPGVTGQNIPAGELVAPGTTIVLTITYAPPYCFPTPP